MSKSRYTMRLSLNVLNHMGLSLYSNTPAVIAEVIANAWDADATEVDVEVDAAAMTITVCDNGVGMDLADVNEKYLYVGYRKRETASADAAEPFLTERGRKPMGRKGIGKLSLFAIANRISVYTKKQDAASESFLLDAERIKEAIEQEDPSTAKDYEPEEIPFDKDIHPQGTILHIDDLKKTRITRATLDGLKKRIARRFSVLDDFQIRVNGESVTFEDRDYFHKARFIFQYKKDYAVNCENLDRDGDTGKPMQYNRPYCFDEKGQIDERGRHAVEGWIAIARRSNDLDGEGSDDNLNKIAIVVRGKVAQEDILQEFRLGGMITKYMFGEIAADFLDEDDAEDIATSSRQSIAVDDARFNALKTFLRTELQHIWTETNRLKDRKGLENALTDNPPLREWYGDLPKKLQPRAQRIFAEIDKATIDEDRKRDFYASGVLAFERLKMDASLDILDTIDETNVEAFLDFLAEIDAIEAANYREIVKERLKVIQKLSDNVAEDVKELVLQEYIFDHLWLLDPAWERATEYATMEQRIQAALPDDSTKTVNLRTDIRYRRVAAGHVIVELKRGSRRVKKTEIEDQLLRYMHAARAELKKDPAEAALPVEGVCLIGTLPRGWDDAESRRADEESLRPHRIRVMTYSELINNAESAYAKFLAATKSTKQLSLLIDRIREYTPDGSSGQAPVSAP